MDSYVIIYERLTGSQQLLCTDDEHSYSYSVGSGSSSYTLTGLQEYSVYSISLVAIVSGVTSTPATTQVTTLKTGKIMPYNYLHTMYCLQAFFIIRL